MKDAVANVFIVGAGPGDPELISLKGLKALQRADIILYDALVSAELLDNAKPGCKKVFVGKRRGKKEFPQDEINRLIVFYAVRLGCVVRLKGGDPYVFGRGHEELEYVQRRGIPVEVIPGISSALAAPTAAGIPLTKRGVNESFWVITGTLSSGQLANDIQLAAQSTATIVILMGISHLEKIAAIFQGIRSPDEPMAVIQDATTKRQKSVIGTAATILQRVKENEITSPAVIVVGTVIDEHVVLNPMLFATIESLPKND